MTSKNRTIETVDGKALLGHLVHPPATAGLFPTVYSTLLLYTRLFMGFLGEIFDLSSIMDGVFLYSIL